MNGKVYIVILNYNGWRDTITCLESVFKINYPDFKVIVVDNKSTDDSIEHIVSWAEGKNQEIFLRNPDLKNLIYPLIKKPIRYALIDMEKVEDENFEFINSNFELFLIQSDRNGGYSYGNNIGIKFALKDEKCKFIWLLNNDTIVDKSSLTALVRKANSDSKIGIVGSIIYHMDKPTVVQAWGGGKVNFYLGKGELKKYPCELDYITGSSMLIKAEVLKQVGLLDERFFLFWEDVDFSFRAKKYGYNLAVAEDSIVYHFESASIGHNRHAKDKVYSASKILFYKKHSPFLAFAVNFVLKLARRLLLLDFNGFINILRNTIKLYREK